MRCPMIGAWWSTGLTGRSDVLPLRGGGGGLVLRPLTGALTGAAALGKRVTPLAPGCTCVAGVWNENMPVGSARPTMAQIRQQLRRHGAPGSKAAPTAEMRMAARLISQADDGLLADGRTTHGQTRSGVRQMYTFDDPSKTLWHQSDGSVVKPSLLELQAADEAAHAAVR